MSSPSFTRAWIFGALALASMAGAVVIWLTMMPQPRSASEPVTLYYSDPQAMFLVPVEQAQSLPAPEPASEWAAAMVERLRQAPDPSLVPVLTPDIKLLEATYRAPEWAIKMQVGPGFGSVMERLVLGGVVRSFVASYPGAERVEVRLLNAKGKPYEGQHLDLSRPLTAADFVNRLDAGLPANLGATVWWRLPNAAHLIPLEVPMVGKSGSLPQDAFERLVAGPPSASSAFVAPVVPAGLKPGWSGVEGTVAKVTLNQTLPESAEGERFVVATVLTLTEHAPIDSVQFLKDGKPLQATVGRFQLSAPVRRPGTINMASAPAVSSHP